MSTTTTKEFSMKSTARAAALAAVGLTIALAATGCAGGGGSSSANGKVSLSLWTNATTGPGVKYFKDAASEYHKSHPDVTIKIQTVQDADLDGKLQTALNSNDAPDIFLQRGGGKMQAMVNAGQIQSLDLSSTAKSAAGSAALAGESIGGKVYAVPLDFLPEGVYYVKSLFQKAGIQTPPASMSELESDVSKLKSAGVTPIAVGAQTGWPAAHWYYNFAVRECSKATMAKTATAVSKSSGTPFSNSCWTKAGDDLASFLKSKPFNSGFLTTPAQTGASSSAALVANHKAAMELMGGWDPGVMASLTPDQKVPSDLGWFPFPSVSGGKGDPSALLGGIDGYSLSKNAPKQATGFLEYLLTTSQQKAYAAAFGTIPVNKDAQSVVTQSYNIQALDASNKAAYESQYLDTLYGQNVGNALNTAVVNLFANKGTAKDIVSAANSAAAKG
jgi:raffinose/stachyose/melibiose transport system substrate-binding protein